MTPVEIKVTIDPSVESQLIAALNLLRAVGGASYPSSDQKTLPFEEKTEETEEKPKTRKEKAAAKKAKLEKAEPLVTVELKEAGGESEPEENAVKTDITLESVREVLSLKVGEYRTEIKGKLTELGAKNLTALEPTQYGEMVDFLKSL